MTRRPATCALAFTLLAPLGALRAQTSSDQGLWFMLFGQGDLSVVDESLGKMRWWFDLQPRFLEETDGIEQLLVRPGLGYEVTERSTAWLGYAYVRTDIGGGRDSNEHRIWQQFLWVPQLDRFRVQSRTRLEQRFLDTGSDTGWRFRHFVKAAYPISESSPLLLTAYEEVFFDLNETSWGQDTGFSQNRLFAGLGWSFDKGVLGEVGYLNQYIDRAGRDVMNHILSVNLILSF